MIQVAEDPTSNIQAPEKLQASKTNQIAGNVMFGAWILMFLLEIGCWMLEFFCRCFSGAWMLDLGTFLPLALIFNSRYYL
jgi:hypothetical protein